MKSSLSFSAENYDWVVIFVVVSRGGANHLLWEVLSWFPIWVDASESAAYFVFEYRYNINPSSDIGYLDKLMSVVAYNLRVGLHALCGSFH